MIFAEGLNVASRSTVRTEARSTVEKVLSDTSFAVDLTAVILRAAFRSLIGADEDPLSLGFIRRLWKSEGPANERRGGLGLKIVCTGEDENEGIVLLC